MVLGPKWYCKYFLLNLEEKQRDPNVSIRQTIPLSRDNYHSDNEWLTHEVTEDEVCQAIKQIIHLKASGPDGMHATFIRNAGA